MRIYCTVPIVALATACCGTGTNSVRTLRIQATLDTDLHSRGFVDFAESVQRESNGMLRIEVVADGLSDVASHGTWAGTYDGAIVDYRGLWAINPAFLALSMPFRVPSDSLVVKAMNLLHSKWNRWDRGVFLAYLSLDSCRLILRPEVWDMAQARVAVPQGDTMLSMFYSRLGLVPVPMETQQTRRAMVDGTIHAACLTPEMVVVLKTRYAATMPLEMLERPLQWRPYAIVIASATMESLDATSRRALVDSAAKMQALRTQRTGTDNGNLGSIVTIKAVPDDWLAHSRATEEWLITNSPYASIALAVYQDLFGKH